MTRRGRIVLVVVLLLGLAATGVVVTSTARTDGSRPQTPSPAAHTAVDPRPARASEPGSTLVVPEGDLPAPSRPPTRVRIPALGVDSSLDALQTDRSGGLMAPPRWQVAGWFADGTRPGDTGPAVVAGHVDSPTGPAVFARLSEIAPGDTVTIDQRGGTTARFRVDRTEVVGKHDFPTAAVYGPTPDSQLRLVTCDGPYVESSGGYQDNLIVYATKVTQ